MCMAVLLPHRAIAQAGAVEADLFATMRAEDKAAVVAVYTSAVVGNGTGAFEEKLSARLANAFPQCFCCEAWTAPRSQSAVGTDGRAQRSLTDVLRDLHANGFTHILLQPVCIAAGNEMAYIRHEATEMATRVKEMRVGEPLFSGEESFQKTIMLIAAECGNEKSANILVADETSAGSAENLAFLEYLLHDKGYENWYVTAMDEFPTTSQLIRQLKSSKTKKAQLIPLTLSPIDRLKMEELDKELKKNGCKATVAAHSLMDSDGVLDLLVERAVFASKHRTYDALERRLQGVR